ncbi:MAG: NADH:quinone oxidoreductase subunit K [Candidatus Westeberhardia cardiocondylae]|nr:NADH:quinone oxidoreductase subunit K [Candidatus Westeberhardia cardiocondylae]
MELSLQNALYLPSILFIIGLTGTIICKNILSIFLGTEIMINSASMAYIISENYWKNINGQIMYIIIITVIASEASIFLILLLKLQKIKKNLNIKNISMR